MQKVITINLNGRAYQLDETAYEALRAYLNTAETQLKDNPDRAEILRDFEQAIAEKCGRYLGPQKTVVAADEMDAILKEMGPVEGGEPSASTSAGDGGSTGDWSARVPPRKRLYRIREGQMMAGVCNGLAAYVGIDVTIVRIIFLVLGVFTAGWALLAYWGLVFVVPEAQTADERAAAHGQPPFNAQELIDQAKKTAADFKATADVTKAEWRRQWREQQRQWRAQHREWRRQWRDKVREVRATRPWPVPPDAYSPPAWAGVMLPLFSLVSLAFFVTLIVAIASLVNTGAIWGWPLPPGIPMWAGILILIVLFQIVTAPLRAARHASYYAWGHPGAWFAAWDGLIATGVTLLFMWLLYTHMPPTHDLREFMHNLPVAFRSLIQELSMWIRNFAEQFK